MAYSSLSSTHTRQHASNGMRADGTERNETKRNETKRNETKRNEMRRNETSCHADALEPAWQGRQAIADVTVEQALEHAA